MPYAELALARQRFFAQRDITNASRAEKRRLAREALQGELDFLACYYEEPLSKIWQFGGLCQHRAAVCELISDVQQSLNGIITKEHFDLPIWEYVPGVHPERQ